MFTAPQCVCFWKQYDKNYYYIYANRYVSTSSTEVQVDWRLKLEIALKRRKLNLTQKNLSGWPDHLERARLNLGGDLLSTTLFLTRGEENKGNTVSGISMRE